MIVLRYFSWIGCVPFFGHQFAQCECCGETSCVHCGEPEKAGRE